MFKIIPIKIPMIIFHKNRENNPKICVEPQKTSNSQSNLEQKEQSCNHHTTWLQNRAPTRAWYWHKNRLKGQGNSVEPGNTSLHNSQLDADKSTKNVEERSLFNRWFWEHWIATCIKMKLDSISHHINKSTDNASQTEAGNWAQWLTHSHPISKCLSVSSHFSPNSRSLLMHTLGGGRWWLK